MTKTIEVTDQELMIIKICLENYKKRVEFLKKNNLIFKHKEKILEDNIKKIEDLKHRL